MKYHNLYPPFVDRIFTSQKNAKNPEKAAKTKLHQLYGAYTLPNSNKKASQIIKMLTKETISIENINKLLKLHASTNERIPFYKDFYDFIIKSTGNVKSILDLGCGFNPFSIPFLPMKICEYHAIDIDVQVMELTNIFFDILGLPPNAVCADLDSCIPKINVDLTFMLKLLPVLEANNPGKAYKLLDELSTKWLVITFPTRSLGGKKKGMKENYQKSFINALNENSFMNYDLVSENCFGNELMFILQHKGRISKL